MKKVSLANSYTTSFKICLEAKESGVWKATGRYRTYSVPGKTAALVPEFAVEDLLSAELQPRFRVLAVKDLPLGRTHCYYYYHHLHSSEIITKYCLFQMPTHFTIMHFDFHTRRIDGIECGLFSNHVPHYVWDEYLYSVL